MLPLLEHYLDRTPGSLIEEKEFALVWHHRLADPEFGEWLANELVATLDEMLADSELQAIRGQKTVEVRLVWANKGSVVDRLEAEHRDATFRLAMGDDRTDEDLFERHARPRLDGPRGRGAVDGALLGAHAGRGLLVPGPARPRRPRLPAGGRGAVHAGSHRRD